MIKFFFRNYKFILFTIGVLAVIGALWLYFAGDSLFISLAVHDLFVPINASYAIESGLTLHKDFHTPFGWIYPVICHLAIQVIRTFPHFLNESDINVVAAIIFNIGISFFFCLFNALAPSKRSRAPYLLLLLLLIIPLQPGKLGSINPDFFTWFGMYNKQLWAANLLQLITIIYWVGDLKLCRYRYLAIFAVIQSLFMYFSFHYKVSFFITSFLLFVIPCLYLTFKRCIVYLAVVAFVCAAAAVLTLYSDYSYINYFKDLVWAIESFKDRPEYHPYFGQHLLTKRPLYILLFIGLATYVSGRQSSLRLAQSSLRIKSIRRILTSIFDYKAFVLILIMALILAVNLKADFDQPTIYLYLVTSLFFIHPSRRTLSTYSGKFIATIPVLVILFTIVTGVACFSRMAYYQYKGNFSAKRSMNKVEFHRLDGSTIRVSYIKHERSFSDTIQLFLPEIPQSESEIAEYVNIATLVKDEFPFYQATCYSSLLRESLDTLNMLSLANTNNVQLLSFVNPLPALTKLSFPTPTDHWIHIGTTHTLERIEDSINNLKSADVVIVPIESSDSIGQGILNANFFLWNSRNKNPFKIFKVTRNAFYFAKEHFLHEKGLREVITISKNNLRIIKSNLDSYLECN